MLDSDADRLQILLNSINELYRRAKEKNEDYERVLFEIGHEIGRNNYQSAAMASKARVVLEKYKKEK